MFAAAVIHDDGNRLDLISDAFGLAPFYFRQLGELILFATNPRYLSMPNDQPDYLAWRCQIQAGFIPWERSLSIDIRRVPAGCVVRFSERRCLTQKWFQPESLSQGRRQIDRAGLAKVEESFQVAIDRTLRLKAETRNLPLTAGFDSRRILAAMLHRGVDIKALTVEVPLGPQKNYRAEDAHCSKLLSAEFDFAHRILKAPDPAGIAENDR